MSEESALVPGNYGELPREAKKTNDSTFDRIYKSIHNSKTRIELTSKEEDILVRWEKAWLLLCRHRTRKQVTELLTKLFNVERSVAYDDVRNACMLFSDPKDDLKDAKRAIAEDALLKGADKAWKTGNLDAHLKYIKEYTEINRLKEDAGADMSELMKNLKPTVINIIATKGDLESMASKLQEELIRDIEHIELNEGEDKAD